jgi:hypothetical protein
MLDPLGDLNLWESLFVAEGVLRLDASEGGTTLDLERGTTLER